MMKELSYRALETVPVYHPENVIVNLLYGHHNCAGSTPGNPLDAVIVGYYDDDKLIYAAKVRNGFVPRVRREVWQKFKGLEIATCPFVKLPEKNARSFRPP